MNSNVNETYVRGNIHHGLLVLHILVCATAEIGALCLGLRKFFVQLLKASLAEPIQRCVFALQLGQEPIFVF